MAGVNQYSCPFCHRPYRRLEGEGTTGLRYHLSPSGPCQRLPVDFSGELLEQIIEGYKRLSTAQEPISEASSSSDPTQPKPTGIWAGSLVNTGDQHQVGRLISVNGHDCTVRIFLGPGRFEDLQYATSQLTKHKIPTKSRVYMQLDESEGWRVGHILGEVPTEPHMSYRVGRPGRSPLDLSETKVEVLSGAAKLSPADALASGAVESQRVYENRKAATDAIFNYRAAGRGMTGPLSSSIALLPHQIEVIRRIMADPIQRYLLADEVGLGKTIEVGAIIRQILLDNPDEEIAIVVPRQLVPQWNRELAAKFHLGDFGEQLRVIPFEQLRDLSGSRVTTLVVDEAHNLIESVIAGYDKVSDSPKLQMLIELCAVAERLFLLSATPVVAADPATLVLLNLLDPVSYRLDQPEQFEQKVELRQQIGRLLLRLRWTPGANIDLLDRAIGQLSELIPHDEFTRKSKSVVGEAVQNPGDDSSVDLQVRQLRDVYSLR